MKIASGHNEKTFYNHLNWVAEGHLYDQIKAVALKPLPQNYERFKAGQRQRIGAARVAEQFTWSIAKEDRQAKPGSVLGASILKYLEVVEEEATTEQAIHLAEVIPQRLGEIVTRIMEGIYKKQSLKQQPPMAQAAPAVSIS